MGPLYGDSGSYQPPHGARSVFFRQKDRRCRAICLADYPDAITGSGSIGAEDSAAFLYRLIVQPFVFLADLAPVASDVTGEELARMLSSSRQRRECARRGQKPTDRE